nr:helix-turn-helix transcriptional regulator [Pseudomonas khazarica]
MTSIYSDSYQLLLELLVTERKTSGLTQTQLADRLGRPQSFVSKYERGERRLDVVELLQVCRAIGADPHRIVQVLVERQSQG